MSPSPVREALRELGRLGLVVQIPHKGAHVAELSAEDLRDTYDVRLVLETKAVWLAAERFGPADEAAAETHLAAYDKALWASAMRDARASHSGFHFALYSAAGSPWLLRLIRPVWENSERYRFMTAASAEALRERDREHRQILEACIEHDADRASALLHDHLSSTVAHVAKHMGAA
jgi:DNA-binding GntR family transcriptional regulator